MFLFAGLMAGAWAATLLLGQPQYVKNVLFADYTLVYSIQRLARNLGNLIVKSGPSLFLLAALAVDDARFGMDDELGDGRVGRFAVGHAGTINMYADYS